MIERNRLVLFLLLIQVSLLLTGVEKGNLSTTLSIVTNGVVQGANNLFYIPIYDSWVHMGNVASRLDGIVEQVTMVLQHKTSEEFKERI